MTVLFYSVVEIITLRLSYLSKKRYRKYEQMLINTIIWIVLFSLLAFRDISVGRDYQVYIKAMSRVAEGQEEYYDYTWLPLGFRLFIKMFALTGLPSIYIAYLVSAFIAGVTVYFFLKATIELSVNPTMSLFILFCFCYIFQSMNQFRQMIAVAIVLYSYKYIDNSLKKYCVLITVASLCHPSAIIMIPMYFLTKAKLNRKTIAIYAILGLSSVFLWPHVKRLLLYTTYSYYIGWNQYDTSMQSSTLLNLAVRIVILTVCLSVRQKVVSRNGKNAKLYHFALACTVIQVVAVYITMFSRISTYFYVFYVLLLPEVFEVIKSKFTKDGSRKIVSYIIIGVLILYHIVYFKSQSIGSGYDTYKFLFIS